jgi:hypothetical protein
MKKIIAFAAACIALLSLSTLPGVQGQSANQAIVDWLRTHAFDFEPPRHATGLPTCSRSEKDERRGHKTGSGLENLLWSAISKTRDPSGTKVNFPDLTPSSESTKLLHLICHIDYRRVGVDLRKINRFLGPALAAVMLVSRPVVCFAAQNPPVVPADLVRNTVASEVSAASDSTNFMFRSRKQTPRESQTKLFVQTRDALAAILVAVNDQPLNADRRRAEESRLRNLANNPEELKKKQRQQKEDAERVNRIMRVMPNAFLYEYDGAEIGQPGIGKPGDELVRLRFRPNPKHDPPTGIEQVLTGMRGYVLIDANRNRIAKIDGILYKDVSFGWGILGHLDRGGHFQVEQGDVGDSSWEITRMSLDFTGKILLFKNLVIKSNEVFSDFQRVPKDLTFAQGVALLEKETKPNGRGQVWKIYFCPRGSNTSDLSGTKVNFPDLTPVSGFPVSVLGDCHRAGHCFHVCHAGLKFREPGIKYGRLVFVLKDRRPAKVHGHRQVFQI